MVYNMYQKMVIMMMMMIVQPLHSLKVTPSVSGGGVTLPLFTPSVQVDPMYSSASSTSHVVVAAASSPTQAPRSSYRSADTAQANKLTGFSAYNPLNYLKNATKTTTSTTTADSSNQYHTFHHAAAPLKSFAEGTDTADLYSRNNTSRFFSLNTGGTGYGSQTLDLGLSFTIPFISIPTSSLMNIGDQFGGITSTALASLMDINWPSVIFIGAVILGAALLLPQLASILTELTSVVGGGGFGGLGGVGGGGGTYTTTSYGRRAGSVLPLAPLTSVLTQLDDALAQYDLDSTSCLQRAVCTYVASSEGSVNDGSADATQMIVAGLARSGVVSILGRTTITQAVEDGRSGANCQIQYPKCPFSIAGVLKFLATYATMIT